eukprot:scaffold501_cov355-Pinguiococcus_pyrenoidosus.AAC.23
MLGSVQSTRALPSCARVYTGTASPDAYACVTGSQIRPPTTLRKRRGAISSAISNAPKRRQNDRYPSKSSKRQAPFRTIPPSHNPSDAVS